MKSILSVMMAGVACSAAWSLVVAPVSAATVGYWRFENGNYLGDSSGNGHTITGLTGQTSIPGSGDGSAFPTTVPLTSVANGSLAFGDGTVRGTVADHPDFTPSAFTVEAFVNFDSFTAVSFNGFIGQWLTTTPQRSWIVGADTTGRLGLAVSGNGAAAPIVTAPATSDWVLALNKDYYVAAIWDGALSGTGNNGVTFYLKNLTDDTPMISASVDHAVAALHNSTTGIAIHSSIAGSNTNSFNGYLDELRFSSGVLAVSELLITAPPVPPAALPAPEPSSLFLLASSLMLFQLRRRARQGRKFVAIGNESGQRMRIMPCNSR